nr:hypothetical protein Iba_chr04aCG8180 [Ipomoea batatas]GMC88457.1 hypothetical protein Iba_chr04eCG10250 [Ipomoea batatas]
MLSLLRKIVHKMKLLVVMGKCSIKNMNTNYLSLPTRKKELYGPSYSPLMFMEEPLIKVPHSCNLQTDSQLCNILCDFLDGFHLLHQELSLNKILHFNIIVLISYLMQVQELLIHQLFQGKR